MLKIVSDSSCDRPLIGGEPVACVPMVISTDERSFRDDETLNITEMLDYLVAYKGRSYTSCPSVDSWMQLFEGRSAPSPLPARCPAPIIPRLPPASCICKRILRRESIFLTL